MREQEVNQESETVGRSPKLFINNVEIKGLTDLRLIITVGYAGTLDFTFNYAPLVLGASPLPNEGNCSVYVKICGCVYEFDARLLSSEHSVGLDRVSKTTLRLAIVGASSHGR